MKILEDKYTEENDLLLPRNDGKPYIKYPKIGSIYTNVVQRIKLKKLFYQNIYIIM